MKVILLADIKGKGKAALKLGTATGLGQFIMPVLGWYGARSIYQHIEAIDHWIAFFVFLVLGIKIIAEAFKEGESDMLKNQFVNNYFDDGLLFKEDFVVKGRQMPFFLEVFL